MGERRGYAAAFKREAVDLVQSGHEIDQVADQLGIPHGTLWNWVHRAAQRAAVTGEAGVTDETVIDPAAYRAALQRIAELERETEFLGKASAYFARKVHPETSSTDISRSIDRPIP